MSPGERRREHRKSKQRSFPLLAIVLILSAGIVISLVILLIAKDRAGSNNTDSGENLNSYSIVFLDENNEAITNETVKEGDYVVPPKLKEDTTGIAFRGWDIDLISIHEDCEARPIYQDVSQEANAMYLNTYYAQGGDELSVNLWLAGKVDVSELCLYLDFDETILTLVGFEGKAEVSREKDGHYEISLTSVQNMTEGCCVSTLLFQVDNDATRIYTELVISPKRIRRIYDGELRGTNATMVNGQIYIY